jgi:hypothetical protein
MTEISSLTEAEKINLKELHNTFGEKAKLTGCSTLAASFLMIGALIVITCGCLCLMLPGVNAINHVVFPAILPGSLAIVTSIPFILLAVKNSRKKNSIRGQMIHRMIALMEIYDIPKLSRKDRVQFLLCNFLNWKQEPNLNKLQKNCYWTDEYQKKILTEIKEKIGKKKQERNPRQEKISVAIDKALAKIPQKKGKKD